MVGPTATWAVASYGASLWLLRGFLSRSPRQDGKVAAAVGCFPCLSVNKHGADSGSADYRPAGVSVEGA